MTQHLRRRRGIGARCRLERAAGAPQLDAQPDEVGCADPLQRCEQRRGRREQGAQAQHRQGHRGEVAERHTDRHRQRRAPALAQRIRHDQQHGRPGDHEQDGGGSHEGQPEF